MLYSMHRGWRYGPVGRELALHAQSRCDGTCPLVLTQKQMGEQASITFGDTGILRSV